MSSYLKTSGFQVGPTLLFSSPCRYSSETPFLASLSSAAQLIFPDAARSPSSAAPFPSPASAAPTSPPRPLPHPPRRPLPQLLPRRTHHCITTQRPVALASLLLRRRDPVRGSMRGQQSPPRGVHPLYPSILRQARSGGRVK